jgi:DNA primase
MIPDHQVSEVRDRADIVDIIGEFVPLKKSGKDYKARCPFHDEKTPSFYVVPEKSLYKCFGCGASGDVFGFLMKRNGLDFVEAVRHVAQRTGIELTETQGRQAQVDPNRPLYELLAWARDFFRKTLEDPDGGRHARDYLAARGIDADSAERFGLGYAPDSWRALSEAAKKHGFEEALLLDAGLLSTSEKAKEPFDTFRDRVVFPIEDVSGRTVAFGARVLGKGKGGDGGGPKYLNSPETRVYHKGETCYGLSWAKHAVRKESSVLLVEGYMDVVTLAANGVQNVVAPLGTAVTDEQAKLLARFTQRVFLLFDSDEAGLKATFRAGDALLRAGLHPAVVTIPPGEDPDTLVRHQGAAGLRHYVEQAVDVLERKLQMLDERAFFGDIDKTRQALDKLLPTLRAAADPALRDIYVARVADRTGVRRETLESEMLRRPRGTRAAPVAPIQTTPGAPRVSPRAGARASRTSVMGAERTLLLLMVKSRDLIERVSERVVPEDFADPAFRAIFEALVTDPELHAAPQAMDPVAAKRLEELLAGSEELAHPRQMLDDTLQRLQIEAVARESAEIDRQLAETQDGSARAELMHQKERLAERRRQIGEDHSHWARRVRALGTDERHR